jgi:hypothetical protein
MIQEVKKYKTKLNQVFYTVTYLNPSIDINRVYVSVGLKVSEINFNKPQVSWPLNRVNSINTDYISEPFIKSKQDLSLVFSLMN